MCLHKALMSYFKGFPCGTCNKKEKKLALEMGPYKSKANKSEEDAETEEERKCLAAEAAGEGQKPDEGASAVNSE